MAYLFAFLSQFLLIFALKDRELYESVLSYRFYENSIELFDSKKGTLMEINPGVNDPQLLLNRGLYFKGTSSASIDWVLLSKSHTIDLHFLLFRAELPQTLLQKESDNQTFLKVTATPEKDNFSVQIDYSSISISLPRLEYGKWIRLSWALQNDPVLGSTLSCYVNKSKVEETHSPDSIADPSYGKIMIANQEFIGYWFDLHIYEDSINSSDDLEAELPCPCDLCYLNNQCLSECPPDQFATDQCNNCMPECSFGCARDTDCRIHPDPYCMQYDNLIASSCISCIQGAIHDGAKCVCPENSAIDPISKDKCECKPSYSGPSCTQCVRWVQSEDIEAYFSKNYMTIILDIEFDIETRMTDCMNTFHQDSSDLFGQGFYCYFINRNQIVIELGENYSIRNDLINLNPGVLRKESNECGFSPLEIQTEIQYKYPFPAPSIVVNAPQGVNYECENLFIEASGSSGRLKHSLEYEWAVKASTDVPRIANNPEISYTESSLYIPKEYLEDTDLDVTLKITNFLEVSSSINLELKVRKSGLVSIAFEKPTNFVFYADEFAQYAVGSIYSCSRISEFQIEWKLLEVIGNSTAVNEDKLWNAQVSSKMLIVPKRLFSPFVEARFQINVSKNEDERGSVDFSVRTIPKEIVIKVDRSSGDIGAYQDLILDASESYDPNENRPLNFLWTCSLNTINCSDKINDPKSSRLFIKSEDLEIGQIFDIELTVFVEYSERSNTEKRNFEFRVVETWAPYALIATSGTKEYKKVVLSKDMLRLVCHIRNPGPFTYAWKVERGGSFRLASPPNRPTITIRGGSMSPGFDYLIAVYVSNEKTTYKFTYSFYVNLPPMHGDFLIKHNPLEFSEVGFLQANNWQDEDLPLSYAFGFTFQQKKFYLNLKEQKTMTHTKFPFSKDLDFWVEVYDRRGDYSKKSVDAIVEKDTALNLENLAAEYEKQIFSNNTIYSKLPGLMNLLAVRVINEETLLKEPEAQTTLDLKQDVFDIILRGNIKLISLIPEIYQDDIGSILSVLELCTKNPVLVSIENTLNVKQIVETLLNRTQDLSFKSMNRLITIVDHMIITDQELIYNNTEIISLSMDLLVLIQSIYSTKMNFDEKFEESAGNLGVSIRNSDIHELNDVKVSLSNVTFALPSDFADSAGEYFPSGSARIGISVLNGKQEDSSVPDIVDLTLYDYESLSHPSINLQESYINFNIQVKGANETAQCVYLDPLINRWDTSGCEVVEVTETEVNCKCNHLTTFSAGNSIASARNVVRKSNLNKLKKPEKLKNIERISEISLYFTVSFLGLYIVLFIFAHLKDRKDLLVKKDKEVPTEEEEKVKEQPKPKSFLKLVLEKHELFNVFFQWSRTYKRVTRATIVFITVLGEVFLIGLFYDTTINPEEEDMIDISFIDSIKEYSWSDFWVMIISALIMIVTVFLFKVFFKIRTTDNIRRTKIKYWAGLTIGWTLISFFCYGILLFSVNFTTQGCYLWIFSSLITVLSDIFVFELLNILIVAYAIYLYHYIHFKMNEKEFREKYQGNPSPSQSLQFEGNNVHLETDK